MDIKLYLIFYFRFVAAGWTNGHPSLSRRKICCVFTCAGVAAELVAKATDTPVAAWRVVTATVAAGIGLALVDI